MSINRDNYNEEVSYILNTYPYVFYTKATDSFYLKEPSLQDNNKDVKVINEIYKKIKDKNLIYNEVDQYNEDTMEIFRKLFDGSHTFRNIIFEYLDYSTK